MKIRARKSDYSEDWHIEQELPCINGLSAWFLVAVAEEAGESAMGYSDGSIGTAEQRANLIVEALKCKLGASQSADVTREDRISHISHVLQPDEGKP